MPARPTARRSTAAILPTLAAWTAVAALAAPGGWTDRAAAQEPAARCTVPTAAATEAAMAPSPAASPTDETAGAVRRATAAASPGANVPLSDGSLTPRPATPAAATPVASDPQALLEAELLATARALAACLSGGPAETAVRLATETYLGQLYAGGEPLPTEEFLLLAPDLDPVPVRIVALDDPQRRGTAATAAVTSVVGNQLLREEWRFVPGDRGGAQGVPWRVDGATPLPVAAPRSADALDVTLAEYAITVAGAATVGPDVVLRGANAGAEDHEMLVLRLAPGFSTADLLRTAGPSLPDEVRWVGQITIAAGATGELVLTGLEPGAYTIVCLLPTDRGTPHLALGMAATFTVE